MYILGSSVDNAYIFLCIIKAFVLISSCRTCNSKMWTYLRFFFYKRLHNWSDQEIVLVVTCLYLCLRFWVLVFWVGIAGILLLKKNLVCVVDIFLRYCCMAISTHTPGIALIRVHSVFLDRQAWQFRACSLIVTKKCLNWQESTVRRDTYLLGPFRRRKERNLAKLQKHFTLHR